MSGLPPGGLNPEDWFGPQPPIVLDERLKLEKKLHEYGRTLDVTDLLKKPILQRVYHFPKAQAFFIDAQELDKAKAIKLGKRMQRHLRGRRTLRADQPYLHHLDLYVGYDGGTVKLPPAMTRARTENQMDRAHEKDIIRTLVSAGHESLAKTFARSRGYRVKADDQDVGDFELDVLHRGMPAPKRMPYQFIKNLSGKSARSRLARISRKARLTIAQLRDFATNKAKQDQLLAQAQKNAGKGRHLISVKLVALGEKDITIANWDPWNKKWVTPNRVPNSADKFQREAFETVKSGIPSGYFL